MAALLAGCSAQRAGQRAPAPAPAAVQAAGAGSYRIDTGQSELRVLVYRAGPLARLGHNHVMVNRALSGSVDIGREPSASAFQLRVPVLGFVVDDTQARLEEGADFAGTIPEDAKSGTLRNMRSAAVLDADEFPAVTIRSVSVAGALDESGGGALTASVAVSVAGHESTLDVPFTFTSGSGRLSAHGSLEIRHAALGLTPYSLMLGALQVRDAMTIKFRITAIRI